VLKYLNNSIMHTYRKLLMVTQMIKSSRQWQYLNKLVRIRRVLSSEICRIAFVKVPPRSPLVCYRESLMTCWGVSAHSRRWLLFLIDPV
jgi:hypothetical protein